MEEKIHHREERGQVREKCKPDEGREGRQRSKKKEEKREKKGTKVLMQYRTERNFFLPLVGLFAQICDFEKYFWSGSTYDEGLP